MIIERLELEENPIERTEHKAGFWKRQFQAEFTTKQKTFDWTFGIILPVICCFFDPIVFRSTGFGENLLGDFKPFAYILSFVSIMSLLAFMLWGRRLQWLNGFLSGLFAIGAIISLGVGVVLLPISLMGLVILIGALGFTPLFAAFVYWRNAVRAYKNAYPVLGRNLLLRAMVLSAMFSFITPGIINIKIHQALETMKNGDAQTIVRTLKRLKYVAPLVDFYTLSRKLRQNNAIKNNDERQAVTDSYRELTGRNL